MADVLVDLEEAMTVHSRALRAVEAIRSELTRAQGMPSLKSTIEESIRAGEKVTETGRSLLEVISKVRVEG